ncbi:hypothetical protein CEXT_691041 [Caerostris extrusa]|uniref:Uncharacterized protein n=1 Tax=Caerostris extrusa TaxID=172846 RepID=A0AAV4SSF3_CAEEX|nr:hypothetical protein CEXT_691041 [Caerostris extrusa]
MVHTMGGKDFAEVEIVELDEDVLVNMVNETNDRERSPDEEVMRKVSDVPPKKIVEISSLLKTNMLLQYEIVSIVGVSRKFGKKH